MSSDIELLASSSNRFVNTTLACVLYSEFDDVAGPRVLYQDPEGFLSTEIFDALSEYIICKPALCGASVSIVDPLDRKIVGFPVLISNSKYSRCVKILLKFW